MSDLFFFSSKNLTNLWAGIGANTWALSIASERTIKTRKTKSKNITIGSRGVFYCSETSSLTTPFLVYSIPDFNKEISNIWPESWNLPFLIHPLGTSRRQLKMRDAIERIPSFKRASDRKKTKNFALFLPLTPTTVFVPFEITEHDWGKILQELADM